MTNIDENLLLACILHAQVWVKIEMLNDYHKIFL